MPNIKTRDQWIWIQKWLKVYNSFPMYLLSNLVALLHSHENFYESLCQICMKIIHIHMCIIYHLMIVGFRWKKQILSPNVIIIVMWYFIFQFYFHPLAFNTMLFIILSFSSLLLFEFPNPPYLFSNYSKDDIEFMK